MRWSCSLRTAPRPRGRCPISPSTSSTRTGSRSILVGQANFASSKGDWQLDFRAAQQVRKQSLGITALIQNLVPSGLAGNFSSLGILKALDMVVNGETTVELSNSGEFLSGEAKLDLEIGTDHAPLGSRQPPAHRPGRAQRALSARNGTWSRSPRRRCTGAAARRPSAASSVPCASDGMPTVMELHPEGRSGGARRRGVRARPDEGRRMAGHRRASPRKTAA